MRRLVSFLRAWPLMLCLIALAGCKDKGTTEPRFGSILGSVKTLEGGAVVSARLDLTGPSAAVRMSDSSGGFAFNDLASGTYRLELRLPMGFVPVPQGGDTIGGALVIPRISVAGPVTLDLRGRAQRTDSSTVNPGGRDTLVTSSGAILEVDARTAAAPVEVRLQESATRSFDQFGALAAPLSLHIAPAGGAARVRGSAAGSASTGTVRIRLLQRVGSLAASAVKFVFNIGTEAAPLYLWANAQSTTYVDPRTGETVTVPLYSADVDFSTPIDAWIRAAGADDECTTTRYLRPVDGGTGSDSRIPLILIHGWQWDQINCGQVEGFTPQNETLARLIASLQADANVTSKYRLYVLRYPSMARVLATSEFLWGEMQRNNSLRGAVLVGHSMGGLVGRGLMMTHSPDSVRDFVRALITLGTPHEGSVLADLVGSQQLLPTSCGRFADLANILAAGFLPRTNGVDDLRPGGEFVGRLRGATQYGAKVFSLAGQISTSSLTDPVLARLACVLSELGAGTNDGVVPVASAAPSWTTLQSVLPGHDHLEIASGNFGDRDELFNRVKYVLSELSCAPAPAPPAANDFPLSGGIARVNARQVDVTLNPIVIDGRPVTGLTVDNFKVIENGCVLPATITTGTGSVGVDIVFAQDLSGSMGSEITGVRSSVVAFAADLAVRGLNVLIGSVGYSGQGTIPTTPPTSACEFLGPVRNLTDATTFQAHVTENWRASGGCDGPENGLEAIEYANRNIAWRPGAARVYIDITDVSHHTARTSCNGLGACTDHTLESIVALVKTTSTIHAVAPASISLRTYGGGLDPWLLADSTGGLKLDLGSGSVDLRTIGIVDIIVQAVRLTFNSASPDQAFHTLRIRADVAGKVAELSPGLIRYAPIHPTLAR